MILSIPLRFKLLTTDSASRDLVKIYQICWFINMTSVTEDTVSDLAVIQALQAALLKADMSTTTGT